MVQKCWNKGPLGQNIMNLGYVAGYFDNEEEASKFGKAVKLEGDGLVEALKYDPEAVHFKGRYASLFFWWEQ